MDNATQKWREDVPSAGLRQGDRFGQEILERRQAAWEQLSAAWHFSEEMYERLARLSEALTPETVKGFQEAALMADAAGRIKLAQNLRCCATQIVEALDMDLALGLEGTGPRGEMWLG